MQGKTIIKMIGQMKYTMIEDSNIVSVVEKLIDKIYFFLLEIRKGLQESLKKTIFYISEAADQVLDIENGVFENAVEIQMRDVLGLG